MCSSTVVGTGDMVVLMAVVSLADQLADLPGEDQAGSRYCYQYDTAAQWWGEGSMYSSTVGTSAGVSHHAAGGAGVFAQLSGGDNDLFHLVGVSWRQLIWVRVDQVGLYLWSNAVHLSDLSLCNIRSIRVRIFLFVRQ